MYYRHNCGVNLKLKLHTTCCAKFMNVCFRVLEICPFVFEIFRVAVAEEAVAEEAGCTNPMEGTAS